VPFEYARIETQVIEALPELRPAAERYWADMGGPGEDGAPYILFSDVVQTYVHVLLALPESLARDRPLARAYELVDRMLDSADKDVRDLAYIEMLEAESPWWYARSLPFLGLTAQAELDQWEGGWRESAGKGAEADVEREIIDLYDVREIVLQQIQAEGVSLPQIPGITSPRPWQLLSGIDVARDNADAVAFVSGFGTTIPYVLCPVADVSCDEGALERLAGDLFDIDGNEPGHRWKAQARLYRIMLGERVWNLGRGRSGEHARWRGSLWIAGRFEELGLGQPIRDVLAGRIPGLSIERR
jgi:hypothetical protein